jgi:hypothetical protein
VAELHAPTPHAVSALLLTIKEKTKAIANMGLFVPSSTPIAVVRPMTCGGSHGTGL